MFGFSSGGETSQTLDVFNSAFQVSFPILPNTWTTYNAYRQPGGTSPYPLDYVVDQAGRVAYFNTEYNPEAMVAVIDALLAQPAPVSDLPVPVKIAITARPNPFNPRTEITFSLPGASPVTLDIHDVRGQLVRHLIADAVYTAGDHAVRWDGDDDQGRHLPAGVYLARVASRRGAATKKLTLVK